MVDGDWVKMHRKIIDSRVFSDDRALKLWIWCLATANWRSSWFEGVEVGVGELVFGQRSVAPVLKMSPSTAWRTLKRLESWDMVRLKTNRKFTIVSLCQWSTYQRSRITDESQMNHKRITNESQMNHGRITDESQMNTLEEVKESKKVKNRESGRFAPPSPEEVTTYGRSIGFDLDGEQFCDYYASMGWKLANGNPLKDWRAAVRTWRRREEAKKPKPFKQRLMTPEEELEWRP
jgi:hypothetical protein